METLDRVVAIGLPVRRALGDVAVEILHVGTEREFLAEARQFAEPGHEIGRFRIDADEDEALPSLGPQREHSVRRQIERTGGKAGRLDQMAGEVIGPAVIGARDRLAAAFLLRQQDRAAMAADIVEAAQRAVLAAQNDDRPADDLGGSPSTRCLEPRLRSEEQPVPAEDGGALAAGDRGIDVPIRRQRLDWHCLVLTPCRHPPRRASARSRGHGHGSAAPPPSDRRARSRRRR